MALLSALLETRPDKYLEHPDNGLLFYRTRIDAGDSTGTSQTLLARDTHYLAARRQKKAEGDAVKAVLRAIGKTGARARQQRAYRAPSDGDLDDRVQDARGQQLFHKRLGVQLPLAWLTDRMTVLDKQSAPPDCSGRHKLGAWMPLWRTQMKFLNVQHLRSPVSHHPDAIDRFILWQYAMAQGYSSELDLIPLRIPRDATYSGPFLLPSSDLFWEYCSIHLSRVALDLGSHDVTLLSRSNLSIQPFDIDVEWVGPRRAKRMAAFWSDRNSSSRANRVRSARFPPGAPGEGGTGASITSEGLALLQEALENGSMKILERTQIVNAKWIARSDEATDEEWLLQLSNSQRLGCDAVWCVQICFGTGSYLD
ncbi:hypothetical protein HDU89_006321 [Geranomyces variabilis]|nr:hypothetical protein HDU89_006321 [Geranomyces variabilis]